MPTLEDLKEKYNVVEVHEINPEDDPRVQADNRKAAEIPVPRRCERCNGTGNELLFMYRPCSDCGGSGLRR